MDEGFVVGMRSFQGNPYDGHAMQDARGQVEILTDQRPELAVVDGGYTGHCEGKALVLISSTRLELTAKKIVDLRKQSAIQAESSHMKIDGHPS